MDLDRVTAESLLRADLHRAHQLLAQLQNAYMAAMAQLVVVNRFAAAVATSVDADGSGEVLVGQEHLDAARARCLFRFRIEPMQTPEGKKGLKLTLGPRPTAEDLAAVAEAERGALAEMPKIQLAAG